MSDARTVLRDLPILKFLPPGVSDLVADSFQPASFSFGATIVREGEIADALYVLVSGRARILRTGDNGQEIALSALRPGDFFGEIGLLERTARTATVRASSDVEVLRLDKSVFEALVRREPEIRKYFELHVKHRHLHNFFRQYTAFTKLPPDALRVVVTELEPVEVGPGQIVIRQGEAPGPMYVVQDGRLRVFTQEDGHRSNVGYLRRGDFFGEMSLFKGIPRTASVEAVSPSRLLKLTPETFGKLITCYPDFRAQLRARIDQYDYKRIARVPLDFEDEILPADAAHVKVGPDQVDYTAAVPASTVGPPVASPPAAAPFATPAGHFIKKGRRIRRFRFIQQVDETDCGAACLAMVCRHFGRAVSLTRIRQLAHTSLDGTSLKALTRAATELGLAARSMKASPRNLPQMPLPAIAHWGGNHWVVLYDVDTTSVKVADPAWGLRRMSRQEFESRWSGYTALFDYTEEFRKAPVGQRTGARWLWTFFRPYAAILLQALGLAAIVSALQLVVPVFTQVVVDRVVVERDVGLLRVLVLGMLATLVFMTLALVAQRYLLSFVTVRVDSATLDFLTRRLLALPMIYFLTRRTGDLQRRLAGVRNVRQFIAENGVAGLMAAVQLIATLVLMLVYSPVLALAFMGTVPLYAGLMHFSARWLRPMYRRLEEAYGRYHSYQIDAIKGITTVKALAVEGPVRELMLHQFNREARRRFRADFMAMSYHGILQAVTFLSAILFLWVGARQVMSGDMTIGVLVAFGWLMVLANASIAVLVSLWDDSQQATVLLNRLNDILEQEPEQGADRSRLIPVRTLEGRISLRNVGFRFGGSESPPILEGITFDVLPNKMVAIVGRSGSGKTTLIKCLAGLLEPTTGNIFYDGVELKTLNYRDLRRNIGFVLQENHLFDDTIARNIAFGEEEPDMDAVLWAARVANAHEFIERLPLGYDTRVGESGVAISAGQRQRLAIARALYRRPPLLMLDEATSALDTESERAVKDNLDKLLAGRTSFVVAHRLSTVRDADLIVVLEKGRVVEQGTHDELMERQGLYYYLCSQQLDM